MAFRSFNVFLSSLSNCLVRLLSYHDMHEFSSGTSILFIMKMNFLQFVSFTGIYYLAQYIINDAQNDKSSEEAKLHLESLIFFK